MDKNHKRLFTVFFILKMFCAFTMTVLTVYYWKMSDNTAYFTETRNMLRLIRTDISNIQYFFLPVDSYNEKIKLDSELTATLSSLGLESNFLLIKISTLLYPIALGRYLIINLLFSVIAVDGQFKLFMALSKRYPHLKKNIAVAVLLMPSVLLYSSFMNKETLCMAFMGFAFYNFFQILYKRARGINTVLLLLNIYFIGTLKSYILVPFLIAVLLVYLIKLIVKLFRGSLLAKIFITSLLITSFTVLLTNLDYFDPYILDAAKTSNTFQEQYNSIDESTTFEFGEVETSFAGLLKKIPLGIYTTYFRPQLWEVNKPIILLSALESFIVFIITLLAIIIKRKYIGSLLRHDFFASICFYYALIFGAVVGLTTFNFGSLIRYKIPGIPFLMMFIFLLLHHKYKKDEADLKIGNPPAEGI
ncbi:MAG: hypothetical protein ABIN36_18835 [Ferruginibacter sp.]